MILIALYLSSERNKSFINNYALPLIISSIVLGHLIDNIKNVKIGNPFAIKSPDSINSASPTNSPSSSTDKTHSTTLVEEDNKTFQAILDTAVNSFIKTNDAIKTIQNNILNDPELDYILSPLNPEEKEKKFLSSFKKVISLPENYNYTKIVKDAKTNPRNIKKISTTVILAIYNYQKNNKDKIFSTDKTGRTSPVKADGIIDKVDVYQAPNSTMAILQNDIKQQIMN
jgi:hypothetical protein